LLGVLALGDVGKINVEQVLIRQGMDLARQLAPAGLVLEAVDVAPRAP
jgi:hypothetical protein